MAGRSNSQWPASSSSGGAAAGSTSGGTAGHPASDREEASAAVHIVVGGQSFESTETVLRRGAEFFDRLFEGRDMEPAARKLPDGTVKVDRDGALFGDVLRFFDTQNAGELPKEEGARQRMLEEARYYEARELVRVLSGQIERHATIGAVNMQITAIEDRYRNLFAQHRDHADVDDPVLTMIKMYAESGELEEDFDFKHFHASKDADRFAIILRGAYEVPVQGPSVLATSMKMFERQFHQNTSNIFQGFDWSNVFVAGGSVLRSLTQAESGSEDAFQGSDVDLFLFGMSSEDAMAKLHSINKHIWQKKPGRTMPPAKKMRASERVSEEESLRTLSRAAVLYARTKGSVTFVVGDMSIQVILRLYKSRPEVLMAFDLDSCAVGYDGTSVWALPRCRRALNGRLNMIDETRPNVKYEARLFKYSLRGFAVGVPGMHAQRENVDYNTYADHVDNLPGLGKLLRAEMIRLAFSNSEGKRHFEDATFGSGTLSETGLALLGQHVQQNANVSRKDGVYGLRGSKTIFGIGDDDLDGLADDALVKRIRDLRMETRGSGYEKNVEMESLQFYRECLTLKHLPGHERDTPLGPLSPFMNMENAVRFILGRPVSWYDTWRMGVGWQGFMQLLMTVHEYERRFQVLKEAISDGVLDDDGDKEPELETNERKGKMRAADRNNLRVFKMKMKMHMMGDLRIRWWDSPKPGSSDYAWAWWLPGSRSPGRALSLDPPQSPMNEDSDNEAGESDEEAGQSVTFGQELHQLKTQQARALSHARTVWKCLHCTTVNPVNRYVCASCRKHRRSAELIKNPGLADDSEMLDEHDELFCAPVFLSDNFEQLLTGEPTLHEATSVPQDVVWHVADPTRKYIGGFTAEGIDFYGNTLLSLGAPQEAHHADTSSPTFVTPEGKRRKQKAAEFLESEETSQIESRARELDEREKVIIAKEKQLMERERECKRREGVLSVEGEALSASIKVKREKLEDSKVLTAQMQDVLQQRLHQLQLLSGQAAEHGKEMAALHGKMNEFADKVLQVQEAIECSVCMENPASTALIPCGHCFCCKDGCGSSEVSVCPCCRAWVKGRTELFGALSDASVAHHDVVSVADAIGAAARALATTAAAKLSQHQFDGMPAESGESSSTPMHPTTGSRERDSSAHDPRTSRGAGGQGAVGDGAAVVVGEVASPTAFLVPLQVGMKVVAYFVGKKGCVGWYDATVASVDEAADEYVVAWDDGEKKDTRKNASHIALHMNLLRRTAI